MYIQLNGQKMLLTHSETLLNFLKKYRIEPQTAGIAVAVNGQIIGRSEWAFTSVKGGDTIEIVHAVSGG